MNYLSLLKGIGPLGVVAAAGMYGLYKCMYVVDGGHRAIKFSRLEGIKPTIYREGWHLMIPYIERPIIYEVRSHPKTLETTTGSKDLQTVDIGVRVLYRPNPEKLPALYRFVGKDYDERVLPSIINEVVKTVVVILNMQV
jgi:prohibitin 2